MTTETDRIKRIDGQARTVRQLLDGARYTIDFYQREYAWQERHVRDLLDDLTSKFEDWQRLDGIITSKICTTVPGGWIDEAGYQATADRALATMKRIYEAMVVPAMAALAATA